MRPWMQPISYNLIVKMGLAEKWNHKDIKGVKLFCFRSDFFFFLESSSGSRQKGACCHQTKYLTESLNSQSNYFCSCSWRCCPLEWMFFAQKCNHWKMLWQEYLRTTILSWSSSISQWTMDNISQWTIYLNGQRRSERFWGGRLRL